MVPAVGTVGHAVVARGGHRVSLLLPVIIPLPSSSNTRVLVLLLIQIQRQNLDVFVLFSPVLVRARCNF